jgi:Spy/CpxP family protein refolding chaperone
MKKVLHVAIWCVGLLLTIPAVAQNQDRQKIESAKIGLITNRLNLTTEQAPQFWAVYNEYSDRRKDVTRKLRQPGKNAMESIEGSVELKQKLVDLEKEYNAKFLKVISAQQLQELHQTERTFNQMLIDKIKSNE